MGKCGAPIGNKNSAGRRNAAYFSEEEEAIIAANPSKDTVIARELKIDRNTVRKIRKRVLARQLIESGSN